MKKYALIIGCFLAIPMLFLGGCYGLVQFVRNNPSCAQFNIDNVEVRTGINIPKVEFLRCTCENNIKETAFKITEPSFNEEQYLSKYNFFPSGDMYKAGALTDRTDWQATYNPETQEVAFRIVYKDL